MEDLNHKKYRIPKLTPTEKYKQTIKILQDTLTRIWNKNADDESILDELINVINRLHEQEARL